MPAGDGTGPVGQGPMTGRGLGFCAGYSMPGYAWGGPGRGFGGHGGGGRGWRNRFWATGLTGWQRAGFGAPFAYGQPMPAPAATVTAEQELGALRAQAQQFEVALENIQKRIDELASKDA